MLNLDIDFENFHTLLHPQYLLYNSQLCTQQLQTYLHCPFVYMITARSLTCNIKYYSVVHLFCLLKYCVECGSSNTDIYRCEIFCTQMQCRAEKSCLEVGQLQINGWGSYRQMGGAVIDKWWGMQLQLNESLIGCMKQFIQLSFVSSCRKMF